jgi:hypothetical protein
VNTEPEPLSGSAARSEAITSSGRPAFLVNVGPGRVARSSRVPELAALAGWLSAAGAASAAFFVKSGPGAVSGSARRTVSSASPAPDAASGANSDAAALNGPASSGPTDPDALVPGRLIGMLDPDGLLAATVASAADGATAREAPDDPAGLVGQTEPEAGQTDTDPDGLIERVWPAEPPGSAAVAGLAGLAGSADPDGSGGLTDSGALISAAESADPPVPSVGWPSCPGRLVCAPICTTSSSLRV